MSTINLFSASTDIRGPASASRNQRLFDPLPSKRSLILIDPSLVEISALAREKQQIETQLATITQIEDTNELVRVTSSQGQSSAATNLNQKQATSLYRQIAAMLTTD
jgi:hypothetical protein